MHPILLWLHDFVDWNNLKIIEHRNNFKCLFSVSSAKIFEEAAAVVPSETLESKLKTEQVIPQKNEVAIANDCPKNSPSDFAVISDEEVAKMRTEKAESDNDL